MGVMEGVAVAALALTAAGTGYQAYEGKRSRDKARREAKKEKRIIEEETRAAEENARVEAAERRRRLALYGRRSTFGKGSLLGGDEWVR